MESGPNGKGAAGSLGVWLLTGSMPGGGDGRGAPRLRCGEVLTALPCSRPLHSSHSL